MKPMHRLTRSLASCAVGAIFALASSVAVAEDANASSSAQNGDTTPGAAAIFFDLALARPVGLATTVLGTAVFLIGLPVEAIAGDVAAPARRLVIEPAQFTFTRKLGAMEGEG